ncbi:MAG TPA: hypothetical protein VG321_10400 [Solirubrobacteraceae bacterium]|nr:hypothetical protein [Solirubrobacteraceae bacterium]
MSAHADQEAAEVLGLADMQAQEVGGKTDMGEHLQGDAPLRAALGRLDPEAAERPGPAATPSFPGAASPAPARWVAPWSEPERLLRSDKVSLCLT